MQFEQKNAGPLVVISTAAPHARAELFRCVEGGGQVVGAGRCGPSPRKGRKKGSASLRMY